MHWMLSSDNNVLGYQQHGCDVYRTNANVKVFIEATTLLSAMSERCFVFTFSFSPKKRGIWNNV